jgi:hypothetical protein
MPERVAVITRIFSEAADQGMGADLIARRFNKEGIPTFGKSRGWHKSYVLKILSNRAVIGEFQPHTKHAGKRSPAGPPLSGYYLAIIDDDLFYRAQAAREIRRQAGSGRKGLGFPNLFSGLLRCGICDGPIHFINKGEKGGRIFVCDDARRGMIECWHRGWKYEALEKSFLTFIREVDIRNVIGQLNLDSADISPKAGIRETQGRLAEAKSRRDRGLALILDGNSSEFLTNKFSRA